MFAKENLYSDPIYKTVPYPGDVCPDDVNERRRRDVGSQYEVLSNREENVSRRKRAINETCASNPAGENYTDIFHDCNIIELVQLK